MGIFNRKKKDAEKDDEKKDKDLKNSEEKSGKGKASKGKRIKDLNPLNKRRRREPVRAWNKYDRIFIVILIFVTFGLSFYFALGTKSIRLPILSRISLPRLNLFSDETIVLTPSRKGEEKIDAAVKQFVEKTEKLEGKYGFYVINLKDGQSFGVFENDTFQAASLIKLPVMVGMYIEAEEGNLNLDTVYELKSGDKLSGSGSLYNEPAGYKLTYREMIELMGKQSDNSAFNICRNE